MSLERNNEETRIGRSIKVEERDYRAHELLLQGFRDRAMEAGLAAVGQQEANTSELARIPTPVPCRHLLYLRGSQGCNDPPREIATYNRGDGGGQGDRKALVGHPSFLPPREGTLSRDGQGGGPEHPRD